MNWNVSSFVILAGAGLLSCSSSGTSNSAKPAEAGAEVAQKGYFVDITSGTRLSGVLVDLGGGATGTTNAQGEYSIQAPLAKPFILSATKAGYLPLREQEWSIDGDNDRGKTNLIDMTTVNFMKTALALGLEPIDTNAGGILGVYLEKAPTCASTAGATIDVSPKLPGKYFLAPRAPSNATSVDEDAFPSAAYYNVPAGQVTITVTPKAGSTCKQAKFPYKVGTLTYSGKVEAVPGEILTFARVYLE